MSNVLGWHTKGFYDGKVLLLEEGLDKDDCIFLDLDINRSHIRSVGHHVVAYNKRLTDELQAKGVFQYSACIQPNNMRGFDGRNDFQLKYPFGTIHLLVGIIHAALPDHVKIAPEGIWPLLFADGVWNNLFGYTENCLDWMDWLGITDRAHILNRFFCGADYTVYEIMRGLDTFLRIRDEYNAKGSFSDGRYSTGGRTKRTGHNLRITDPRGKPINLVPDSNGATFAIHQRERDRVVGFIQQMAKHIGWDYSTEDWCWDRLCLTKFRKGDFSKGRLNNSSYMALMARHPFSLAMTSSQNIEYTEVIQPP